MQRAHHARVVGARVVPDGNNQLRAVKVVQRDSAFADADRLRQANAGRLMAHVGAVGKVIAAKFTRKQLEQVGRFIGRPAGGIKFHLFRRQRLQDGGDALERLVPGQRAQGVRPGVIKQGRGQTAVVLQLIIGFCSSEVTVFCARNSGVTRLLVASQVTALAPFSQN